MDGDIVKSAKERRGCNLGPHADSRLGSVTGVLCISQAGNMKVPLFAEAHPNPLHTTFQATSCLLGHETTPLHTQGSAVCGQQATVTHGQIVMPQTDTCTDTSARASFCPAPSALCSGKSLTNTGCTASRKKPKKLLIAVCFLP